MTAALFFLLAFAALLAFALSSRRRPGAVIYSDTDRRRRGETLVSHRYGLAGRPDYLIRTAAGVTPVEVKSRACGPAGPYPGEKAQALHFDDVFYPFPRPRPAISISVIGAIDAFTPENGGTVL